MFVEFEKPGEDFVAEVVGPAITPGLFPLVGNDGDNRAVTFKITTPLYVIGKKNDSERVRLGKTFVFSPPRTHRTDIFTEIGPQRAAVFGQPLS